MIEGVCITKLDIIRVSGGDVLHAMKESDEGFSGFGEAYFSFVESGSIKAWKRHLDMTLNLVVPKGEVKLVIFDDREQGKRKFDEHILSIENYCRLTIPPKLWVGFKGLSESTSILLNIANLQHDVNEVERKEVTEINYDW